MNETNGQGGSERIAGGPWCHFSVDDVFASLVETADRNLGLFEQPFFRCLRELHDRFGVTMDLYIFLEGVVDGRRRRLVELPGRLCDEFVSAPWLRLGPHALDYDTKPFEQTSEAQQEAFAEIYAQIDRLAGRAARSRWLRLHYFSECYETAAWLRAEGVEALLLTDKPAVAYRLDDDERRRLELAGVLDGRGVTLRRSFTRIETLVRERWDDARLRLELQQRLDAHGYVALFTHEVDLLKPDVLAMTGRCLETLAALKAPTR